ncbi:MAG: hypothetical protein NTZ95_01880, partial [Candidatus Omnitrophica bacterium]|nr:hypothetical protein [Candidatus Omnitrophota bacterium]
MMTCMIQPLKAWFIANGSFWLKARTALTENEVLTVQDLRKNALLRQAESYGLHNISQGTTAVEIEDMIRRESKAGRISLSDQAQYLGVSEDQVTAAWAADRDMVLAQTVEMLTRREEERDAIRAELEALDDDAIYKRWRDHEQSAGARTGRTIEDLQWATLNEIEEQELVKSILDLYAVNPDMSGNDMFMDRNFKLSDDVKGEFKKAVIDGKISLRPETVRMLKEKHVFSEEDSLKIKQDKSQVENMSICVFLAETFGERKARSLANKLVIQLSIGRPAPPIKEKGFVIDRVYRYSVLLGAYPYQNGTKAIIARMDTDTGTDQNNADLQMIAMSHTQLGPDGAAIISRQPPPMGARGGSGVQPQPLSKPGSDLFAAYWEIVRAMDAEYQNAAKNKTVIPDMWEILDEDNFPQRFHYWSYSLMKTRKDTIVEYVLEEARNEDGTYDTAKLKSRRLKRDNPKLYEEVQRWGIKLSVIDEIARDWNKHVKDLEKYKKASGKGDAEADARYETQKKLFGSADSVYKNFNDFFADQVRERMKIGVIQGNPLQMPYGENKSFYSDYNIWGNVKFGGVAARHPLTFLMSVFGVYVGLKALFLVGGFYGTALFLTSAIGAFLLASFIIRMGINKGWGWVQKGLPKRTVFHLDGLSNCFSNRAMFGYYTDKEGYLQKTKSRECQEIVLVSKIKAVERHDAIRDQIKLKRKNGEIAEYIGLRWKAFWKGYPAIQKTMQALADVYYLQPLGPHPADDTTEDKHLGIRLVMTKREVTYCTDRGASVFENAGPVNMAFVAQRSRWVNPVSNATIFAGRYRFMAPFFGAVIAGLVGSFIGTVPGQVGAGIFFAAIGFFAGYGLWAVIGSFIMRIQIRLGYKRALNNIANPVKAVGLSNFLISRNLDSGVESTFWTGLFFNITLFYLLSFGVQFILGVHPSWAANDITFGLIRNFIAPFTGSVLYAIPPAMWAITTKVVGVSIMLGNFFGQIVGNIYTLYANRIGGVEKIRIGYNTYYNERVSEFEDDANNIRSRGKLRGDAADAANWNEALGVIEKFKGRIDPGKNAADELRALEQSEKKDKKQNGKELTAQQRYVFRVLGEKLSGGVTADSLDALESELRGAVADALQEMVAKLQKEKGVFEKGRYAPGLVIFTFGLLAAAIGALFVPSFSLATSIFWAGTSAMIFLPVIFRVMGWTLPADKVVAILTLGMVRVPPDVAKFYLYYTGRSFNMPFYYLLIFPASDMIMGQIVDRQDNRWPYTLKSVTVSINRAVEKDFRLRSRTEQGFYPSIRGAARFLREAIAEKSELANFFMKIKGWRGIRTYGLAFFAIIYICFLGPLSQEYLSGTFAKRDIAPVVNIIESFHSGVAGQAAQAGSTAAGSLSQASSWVTTLGHNWPVVVALVFAVVILVVLARKVILKGKITAEGDRRRQFQVSPTARPQAKDLLDMQQEEILGDVAPYIKDHSIRDAKIAVRIAEALGLPLQQIEMLRRIGWAHDIGGLAKVKYLEAHEVLLRLEFTRSKETKPSEDPAICIKRAEERAVRGLRGPLTREETVNPYLLYKEEYELLKGEKLSPEEDEVLKSWWDHGLLAIPELKNRGITLSPEAEAIIRCHEKVGLLDTSPEMIELSKRFTMNPDEVKLLAVIFRASDILENGNNKSRRDMRGVPIEDFASTIKFIQYSFGREGLGAYTNVVDKLIYLLANKDAVLMSTIYEARQSAELMPEDQAFISSMQPQAPPAIVKITEKPAELPPQFPASDWHFEPDTQYGWRIVNNTNPTIFAVKSADDTWGIFSGGLPIPPAGPAETSQVPPFFRKHKGPALAAHQVRSVADINRALELGADLLETDVQMTK